MIIKIILAWVYRATFQAVFNVVFNAWHFSRILLAGRLPICRYKAAIARAGLLSGKRPGMIYGFDGVNKSDGVLGKWPCWTALPVVFAGMHFRGNCMDGAYFIKRALGGRVWVWIPDGPRWYARVHYACRDKTGRVWSLDSRGLTVHKSLSACRSGGAWI